MSTYIIKQGDTLARISSINYGIDSYGGLILSANPELKPDVLQAGTVIKIPAIQTSDLMGVSVAPFDVTETATNENEVSITIDGMRFRFWTGSSFRRSIGSIDTFAFTAPFEPDNQDFRRIFKPLTYKQVFFSVGGVRALTGTMVNIKPVIDNDGRVVSVSGYGLPGVLNDCPMPATAYPIEYNNLNLRDIMLSGCKPFGISVDFAADAGGLFEQVALKPSKKPLPFYAELAAQRGLVIGNTPQGALLCQKSVVFGRPVARLDDGSTPVLSIQPTINAQQYYSEITGIGATSIGDEGGAFTEKNTFLPDVIRPFSYTPANTDDSSLQGAVKSKLGRMVANAIVYNVQVDTWRDDNGDLWEPNTTVILNSPNTMVYEDTEFIIKAIDFARTNTGYVASLELVLIGAYSGSLPRRLPWDS